MLAKKSDLSDLQRVVAALESKIDINSFESLVHVVEGKADRGELQNVSQGMHKKEVERTM